MRTTIMTLLLIAAGCTSLVSIGSNQSALSGPVPAYQLAAFNDGFEGIGVAGDQRLLFMGRDVKPTESAGVVVASRLTGQQLGSLTPPPGGFGDPVHVQVVSYTTTNDATVGLLLVIDNITPPPTSQPTIYKYTYAYNCNTGFTSQLIGTAVLPTLSTFPPTTIDGLGYVGGMTILPGGGYALADALVGAIWTCNSSFDCQLAQFDSAFGAGPHMGAFMGVGRAQGGGTKPYTLALPGGLMPGLLGLTYVSTTDEVCGYVVLPPGGLYCMARTTLLDQTISPFSKPKRSLIPQQTGLTDGAHGIAYDVYNPSSPWVYWVRSLADTVGGGSNIIRRAHVTTGEVQEVAESLIVMDFSTGLAVLPPFISGSPFTNLAVSMGQEENNSLINVDWDGSAFVTPTLIAGATILSY